MLCAELVLGPFSSPGTGCQQLLYVSDYCRAALETVDRLTESLDFTDYASRIIHPIVRTLDQSPELRPTAMDTLSSLVFQLGKKVRQESSTDVLCYLPFCFSPTFLIQQLFVEPPVCAECCSGVRQSAGMSVSQSLHCSEARPRDVVYLTRVMGGSGETCCFYQGRPL